MVKHIQRVLKDFLLVFKAILDCTLNFCQYFRP